MSDKRRFPILKARHAHKDKADRELLDSLPDTLPWEMLEMVRERVFDNHGQSLKRLAERGGLSVIELACAFSGQRLRFARELTMERAVAIVQQQIDDWGCVTLSDLEEEAKTLL